MIRRPPRSTLFPLHDALPISEMTGVRPPITFRIAVHLGDIIATEDDIYGDGVNVAARLQEHAPPRSEEHTSELQSRQYLVCRLLLEKKKIQISHSSPYSLSI